jgi:hypothetical protein
VLLNEFLTTLSLKEYITLFGNIWDPNKRKTTEFNLWPEQERVCDFIEKQKISLLPKPRQGGLSEIAGERCIKECFQYPKSAGVVISKSEDFAQLFLEKKVIEKIENLPKGQGIEWPKIIKATSSKLILSNGSSITSLSSSQTSAASMRLDFIVFDEAGGIDENHGNFKQLFANAWPTLDQNKSSWAMVIGTSVPGSYYNDMVREAHENKKSLAKHYFMNWRMDPKRDDNWYEDQKKILGDNVFTQFPRTIQDFFYVKEGLVFKEFDQEEGGRHVKRVQHNWGFEFVTGYDHGYVDPACNLYCLYDKFNDHLYVVNETYFKMNHNTDASVIAKTIKTKLDDFPKSPRKQLADTAIFNRTNGVVTTAEVFKRHGVRFDRAVKYDAEGSRMLLSDRFLQNKITIDPSCIGLREELSSWRWDKSGITPEDKNNHAIDPLRYICTECKPQKDSTQKKEERREYSSNPEVKSLKGGVRQSLFDNMNVRTSNRMNSWQAN